MQKKTGAFVRSVGYAECCGLCIGDIREPLPDCEMRRAVGGSMGERGEYIQIIRKITVAAPEHDRTAVCDRFYQSDTLP